MAGWHLRLYRVIRDMAVAEGIAVEIRGTGPRHHAGNADGR